MFFLNPKECLTYLTLEATRIEDGETLRIFRQRSSCLTPSLCR